MTIATAAEASAVDGRPSWVGRARVRSPPPVVLHETELRQNEATATQQRPSILQFETAGEVMATTERSWLVPEVIPAGALAALFGPSGSGKSFLALDLSLALATGGSWFGRPLHAASVAYLCLEGGDGLGKRVRAWSMRHESARLPDNLKFMRGQFRLTDTHALIHTRARFPYAWRKFLANEALPDTWAKSLPLSTGVTLSDENRTAASLLDLAPHPAWVVVPCAEFESR